MDLKSSWILGACVIIAALIVSLVLRPPLAVTGVPARDQAVRSPEGLLVVSFSVTTSKSQTSESWQSGEIEGVTGVEFHPAFIVVQTKDGTGTVFFPEKTKTLNWKFKKGG